MCLGIPAQLVAGDTGHPDLAVVDMGGVSRVVNIGLLDEPPGPGDWVLVHMGFALSAMTPAEARDALTALGAVEEAENKVAADREAASHDAASRDAGREAASRQSAGREAAGREAAGGIR